MISSRQKLREQFSREVVVQPAGITITPEDEVFLSDLQEVMNEHLGDSAFSVDWLAEELGMSRRQLERRVKEVVGEPPGTLLRRLRLERASQLLRADVGTVAEVAYMVGFNSSTQFARAFRKAYGESPGEHVRKSASTVDD
jgi:transcriptional regulator GlxA family with amidase domain